MLADELRARRHDTVHQNRRHAQLLEGIHERRAHELIPALGIPLGRHVLGCLAGIAPTLVGRAQERVAHAERVVQLKAVHVALEGEYRLLAGLEHRRARLTGGNAAGPHRALVAFLLGHRVEARTGQAVEDSREHRTLLEGGVDHPLVIAGEQRRTIRVLAGLARIEGLRGEAHRLLPESQRDPVRAQLLGGIVVEQLLGERRRGLRA